MGCRDGGPPTGVIGEGSLRADGSGDGGHKGTASRADGIVWQ